MQTKTYLVTAIAGNNTLASRALGTVDAAGASIDNVRLFATQQSTPPDVTLADIRPLADPNNDVWTFNIYDGAQRLVQTIDGLGGTSVYEYDGASRLISTRSYANRVRPPTSRRSKARETNPNQWTDFNGLTGIV